MAAMSAARNNAAVTVTTTMPQMLPMVILGKSKSESVNPIDLRYASVLEILRFAAGSASSPFSPSVAAGTSEY